MIRKDLTLLAIAAGHPTALLPVQLQKSLFLLTDRLPREIQAFDVYQFSPYDYGPFCAEVYMDAELLESEGLVEIIRPPASRYRMYGATDPGRVRADELLAGLPVGIGGFIREVVAFTQGLSFNELVSAIYEAYPEMRANSVFQV